MKGKGKKLESPTTLTMTPVEAPEILLQHRCRPKPVGLLVVSTTHGWKLLVGPQGFEIAFCPFCGRDLPKE
jgi:hypothetical protein